MPQSSLGIVDWDDPMSWDKTAAVNAIESLCRTGSAEVPVYDLSTSLRAGTHTLVANECFVAEGLFGPEIVADCRERGILDAAICVRHHRVVTFLLRLARDLREGRKAPRVLLRRGWRLMRAEPAIVSDAVNHGCTPMTPRNAERRLRTL